MVTSLGVALVVGVDAGGSPAASVVGAEVGATGPDEFGGYVLVDAGSSPLAAGTVVGRMPDGAATSAASCEAPSPPHAATTRTAANSAPEARPGRGMA